MTNAMQPWAVNKLQIRDLQAGEAELVANFFHEQWRPNHIFFRNRDLLFWQYRDNPYARLFSDGLTFRAALEENKLVGVFGYVPFVFNQYGTRRYGTNLSAWWVHPDHRRGALGLSLLHSLQQDSPFDACIAGINTPTAEKIYQRMSWAVLTCIPRLLFILDREGFERLLDPEANCPLDSSKSPQPSEPLENGIRVSTLDSFDSLSNLDWDSFYWNKCAGPMLGPARELSYLRWRYSQIPNFRYEALLAMKGGEAAGLLIFRHERVKDREETVVRLVDFVGTDVAVRSLVQSLIHLARERKVTFLDFFCTYAPYLNQLREMGFVEVCDSTAEHYRAPFLFQPLDHTRNRLNMSWWIRGANMSDERLRSDFCMMKGDYEFDRPN